MIRLMAEKVQKVSERVGFPSGNIQIDPVSPAEKIQITRERTKLNTSPPMIAYRESPGKSAVEI